jgi:hypothetical protein
MDLAEILIKIFKLLLVNPQLGEARWLGEDTKYGKKFKYGLSPQIVRTSRWILMTATSVLYGKNRFCLIMTRDNPDYHVSTPKNYLPVSPLTRFIDVSNYKLSIFDFSKLSVFPLVRKWHVLERGQVNHTAITCSREFAEFCKTVQPQRSVSVRITIIRNDHMDCTQRQNQIRERLHRVCRLVLDTVSQWRDIGDVKFNLATADDLNISIVKNWKPIFLPDFPLLPSEVAKTIEMVVNDSPVERVWDMFTALLAYAKTFERYEPFALDMTPKIPNTPLPKADPFRNPFFDLDGTPGYDTVEQMLANAEKFALTMESKCFRKWRQDILAALAPQYKRIVQGYKIIKTFVDEHQDVLVPDTEQCDTDELFCSGWTEKALLLVEGQIKAFERDMDPRVSRRMRLLPIYDRRKEGVRYQALEEMRALHGSELEETIFEEVVIGFRQPFKRAVDDLVDQYIKVVKARRALLAADSPSLACNIDLGMRHEIDSIQWPENAVADDSIVEIIDDSDA